MFGVTGNERIKLPADAGWEVLDPLETARGQVVALKQEGAELIVAITHMRETLDQKLAQSLKDIGVILSGGGLKMVKHPIQEGNTYIASAFMKGKYVSVLTLYIQEGSTAPFTFIDRFKKGGLSTNIAQLEARLATYSRMLEKRREEAKAESQRDPSSNQATIKRGGVDYYEKQVVKIRSEIQLARAELEAVEDADPTADFIHYDLAALDRTIVHDPTVEAAVVKFRKKYPQPKPTYGALPSQRFGTPSTSTRSQAPVKRNVPSSARTRQR